jgi:hypothetical protein
METKEIAMSERTTILGTACVLGMALAAGPAAAATLTGWDASLNTSFSINDAGGSGTHGILAAAFSGPAWKTAWA